MSYVLNTPDDRQEMLAKIGARSIEALFESIPSEMRLKGGLNIPPALTEIELSQHMQELAARNRYAGETVCFLGGGSYDHFIPAVVDVVLTKRTGKEVPFRFPSHCPECGSKVSRAPGIVELSRSKFCWTNSHTISRV